MAESGEWFKLMNIQFFPSLFFEKERNSTGFPSKYFPGFAYKNSLIKFDDFLYRAVSVGTPSTLSIKYERRIGGSCITTNTRYGWKFSRLLLRKIMFERIIVRVMFESVVAYVVYYIYIGGRVLHECDTIHKRESKIPMQLLPGFNHNNNHENNVQTLQPYLANSLPSYVVASVIE